MIDLTQKLISAETELDKGQLLRLAELQAYEFVGGKEGMAGSHLFYFSADKKAYACEDKGKIGGRQRFSRLFVETSGIESMIATTYLGLFPGEQQ